jgi:pSer/pThr/pTyr-binding forkhead associated (FHA) protein
MITCPECQLQELEGTLFCSNCGAALLADDEQGKTRTMPFVKTAQTGASPAPLVGKRAQPAETARRIRFIIPLSGRQVTLPLRERLEIGRSDPRRDIAPDLDLSYDGGSEAGVSRLHAAIVLTAQGLAIMDLDSVNGTWVNNYRIPPRLPFAIDNGDELKLGELVIHVFYEG